MSDSLCISAPAVPCPVPTFEPHQVADLRPADWTTSAACRGTDPDALFVQGAAQNRAKLVCVGCPVRTECLADALDNRIEFGVWGGMTERERRALLRRRPEVTSWFALLDSARREFESHGKALRATG
jgi:WhiB family transcriptional regulator, redox-sensing transcriptional regulator